MHPTNSLLSWLGLVSWGDIAELTLYRDRYRQLVVYQKQYPKSIVPFFQGRQRDLFKIAVSNWKKLPNGKKQQWTLAARRASLRMTGYNLYIAATLIPDPPAIATLQRQTKTTLTLT